MLQGIQLLPQGPRVPAVVTALGAGRGRIPKVLGNGSMAAPGGGSTAEVGVRDPGRPVFIHPLPALWLRSFTCGHHAQYVTHLTLYEPDKASFGHPFHR